MFIDLYLAAFQDNTTRHRRFSPGVAELLVFHPVDTVAKRLMSNKAKVMNASVFLLLQQSLIGTFFRELEGLVLNPLLDHLSGSGWRAVGTQGLVVVSGSRIRRRIQSAPTGLQIRWSAMVQRLDHETLQNPIHQRLR